MSVAVVNEVQPPDHIAFPGFQSALALIKLEVAIAGWVPIASIVMMLPWISSRFSNSGMVVISFSLSSTLSWRDMAKVAHGPNNHNWLRASLVFLVLSYPPYELRV